MTSKKITMTTADDADGPPVTMFKSLAVALKDLEPYIRNGRHLQVGDEFKEFGGLRSRELLGNWLLCVVGNYFSGRDRYTFASDPLGGDGLIVDKTTELCLQTEHVFEPGPHPGAPEGRGEDVGKLILEKIEHKVKRGKEFGEGKTLIVLCNEIGEWWPNRVGRALPDPLHFDAVWVTALLNGARNPVACWASSIRCSTSPRSNPASSLST